MRQVVWQLSQLQKQYIVANICATSEGRECTADDAKVKDGHTAAISHVPLTTHSLCSALHLTESNKKPEKMTVKAKARTFRIRAVTMTLKPFSS